MTPVSVKVRPASLKVLAPLPEQAEQETQAAVKGDVKLVVSMLENGVLDT
jgi:hypothetical protein